MLSEVDEIFHCTVSDYTSTKTNSFLKDSWILNATQEFNIFPAKISNLRTKIRMTPQISGKFVHTALPLLLFFEASKVKWQFWEEHGCWKVRKSGNTACGQAWVFLWTRFVIITKLTVRIRPISRFRNNLCKLSSNF